jgi:hypothetical protein
MCGLSSLLGDGLRVSHANPSVEDVEAYMWHPPDSARGAFSFTDLAAYLLVLANHDSKQLLSMWTAKH